jgi:hypothetical protein
LLHHHYLYTLHKVYLVSWVGTCGKHGQYDLQRLVKNKAFKEF